MIDNFPFDLNPCDLISPYLYLGGEDSLHPEILKEYNIKHIVCLAKELDLEMMFLPPYITGYYLPLEDASDVNIKKTLDMCFNLITECIDKSENILVMCACGISRSPAIVIAYFIRKYRISYERAYNIVKAHRYIDPNPGFVRQLKEYEKKFL